AAVGPGPWFRPPGRFVQEFPRASCLCSRGRGGKLSGGFHHPSLRMAGPAMAEPHYRYLHCSTQQGVLVLAVASPHLRSGDFDLIDQVRQELLAAVTLNGARKVVVDLSEVQYVG